MFEITDEMVGDSECISVLEPTAMDDILRLVFERYTHELELPASNLLTVCRQWHRVLLSSSNIWTHLHIKIKSFHTIPSITGSVGPTSVNTTGPLASPAPFLSYLQRSMPTSGAPAPPLDILIGWEEVNTDIENNDSAFYIDMLCPRESPVEDSADEDSESLEDARINPIQLCGLQTQELLAWLASKTEVSTMNTNEANSSQTRWWRSLFIDLTKVQCHWLDETVKSSDFDIPWQKEFQHGPFCRLESLTIHGVGFLGQKMSWGVWEENTLQIPTLKSLEIYNGTIYPAITLQSLESLTMVDDWGDTITSWEKCRNLRILHLGFPRSKTSFQAPASHCFPHLSTIILEDTQMIPGIFLELEKMFNRSRPLKLLALAEWSIKTVIHGLQSAPQFHAETIRLTRRYLGPEQPKWQWQNFTEEGWYSLRGQDREEAVQLLTEADRRGIQVEAADQIILNVLKWGREELKGHKEVEDTS